jgi:hypothetical protein
MQANFDTRVYFIDQWGFMWDMFYEVHIRVFICFRPWPEKEASPAGFQMLYQWSFKL